MKLKKATKQLASKRILKMAGELKKMEDALAAKLTAIRLEAKALERKGNRAMFCARTTEMEREADRAWAASDDLFDIVSKSANRIVRLANV